MNEPYLEPRGGISDQRDVQQHDVFQERLGRSPVLVAQHYKWQMEAMDCRSIRDFARKTGRDHSVVARHLRILTLPEEVLALLEDNQTPEVLRHFTVKRLDALTRLPDAEVIVSFIQEANAITPREATALA